MHAQMEGLGTAIPKKLANVTTTALREGIRPPQKSEDLEQSLLDQIDRAKTPAERDRLYLQLATDQRDQGRHAARAIMSEKIDDSELRPKRANVIDTTLVCAWWTRRTQQGWSWRESGELSHLHRVWLLTQFPKLLLKTDREKALALLDEASPEAARIRQIGRGSPRALLAISKCSFSPLHRSVRLGYTLRRQLSAPTPLRVSPAKTRIHHRLAKPKE